MVAEHQLGAKRSCPQCSSRFYDLGKNPAHCPKCGHHFNPVAPIRTRRARAERRAEVEDNVYAIGAEEKTKAARKKKASADNDNDMDEIGDIGGGEDIEQLDDMDDIEGIEELEDIEDDDDDMDDDITLEDEDIGDESLVDTIEEVTEEEAEEIEEEKPKKKPAKPVAKPVKKKR